MGVMLGQNSVVQEFRPKSFYVRVVRHVYPGPEPARGTCAWLWSQNFSSRVSMYDDSRFGLESCPSQVLKPKSFYVRVDRHVHVGGHAFVVRLSPGLGFRTFKCCSSSWYALPDKGLSHDLSPGLSDAR